MYVDSILEQFELSPLGEFTENADPYNYFDESASYAEIKAMYEEAAEGANKKNIFQRLGGLIKKALLWIWNKLKAIVSFITGGKRKSAEQLAEDSGIKPNPNAPALPTPKNAGQKALPAPQNGAQGALPAPQKILALPAAKGSEVPAPDLQVAHKQLILQIRDDGNVRIQYKVAGAAKANVPNVGAKDVDPSTALAFFLTPQVSIKMAEAADFILEAQKLADPENAKKFLAAYQEFKKEFEDAENKLKGLSGNVNIPTKMFVDASKALNQIGAKLSNLSTTSPDLNNVSNDVIQAMNFLSRSLADFQMGLHLIGASMQQIYQLDESYRECAKNMEQIDVFVMNCIRSGIPAKYISWNVYMVADKSLKGEGEQSNPLWGKSRIIFVPPQGNVIHKIALSEWARQQIIAEERVSAVLNQHGAQNLIASVMKTYQNKCVVDMEKVDLEHDPAPTMHDMSRLQNMVNNTLATNNIKMDVTNVANQPANVKWKPATNWWCCVDYGWTERR